MTALADGVEHLVDDLVEELLALHVAYATLGIGCFQLFKVLVFGPELGEIGVGREGVHVGEHGISLYMTGVADIEMGRVGVHTLNLLPYGSAVVGEIDAVAQALAHLLLAVSTRQTARYGIVWKQNVWLYQHGRIYLIEASCQLAAKLNHRALVFAGRYGSGLEGCYVSGLTNRIAEETQWNVGFEVAHLNLSLDSWVALHAAHRHQVHEIGG